MEDLATRFGTTGPSGGFGSAWNQDMIMCVAFRVRDPSTRSLPWISARLTGCRSKFAFPELAAWIPELAQCSKSCFPSRLSFCQEYLWPQAPLKFFRVFAAIGRRRASARCHSNLGSHGLEHPLLCYFRYMNIRRRRRSYYFLFGKQEISFGHDGCNREITPCACSIFLRRLLIICNVRLSLERSFVLYHLTYCTRT